MRPGGDKGRQETAIDDKLQDLRNSREGHFLWIHHTAILNVHDFLLASWLGISHRMFVKMPGCFPQLTL
jgi:hypothetical protein